MTTRLTNGTPYGWQMLERRDDELRHDADPTEWIANARLMMAHPFFREACDRQPDPMTVAHYVKLNRLASLTHQAGEQR